MLPRQWASFFGALHGRNRPQNCSSSEVDYQFRWPVTRVLRAIVVVRSTFTKDWTRPADDIPLGRLKAVIGTCGAWLKAKYCHCTEALCPHVHIDADASIPSYCTRRFQAPLGTQLLVGSGLRNTASAGSARVVQQRHALPPCAASLGSPPHSKSGPRLHRSGRSLADAEGV